MFTQSRKELHELLSPELWPTCEEFDAAKGQQLFAVGQKPRHMFFVATGEVVLERPGLQGAPVILQRTRHGFISEASLQSSRYHCDGRVVAHSRMVRLPVLELRQALDHDLRFAGRWITMLSTEVKRLRLQCERLSLSKVQERLRHLLETEGEDGKFPLGAGLKSLAGELGVTHEALYRCIYAMEKQGAIQRSGSHICLL